MKPKRKNTWRSHSPGAFDFTSACDPQIGDTVKFGLVARAARDTIRTMFKPGKEWLLEMAATWAETYRFLDEVSPVGYKIVSAVKLAVGGSGASWQGDCPGEDSGVVTFYHDAEARSIAHEIGHGFGERLSFRFDGIHGNPICEDLAEAIRYFVELRMGMSSWKPRADWLRVLIECDYDEKKFKSKLQDGSLVTFLKTVK